MRDYITTIFNLIVGLIDSNKIVYLALIGLGIILVWQLITLITNFHRRFAGKCRKISKFLTQKGLSASNYNQFLALVAKMPQEFIRGYKTFEHASYGLPSDYIKRFDSIDVEVNGGILNHGKSLLKATIYGWTIILALLSFALLGSESALTGYAVADALVVPVLFLLLAKIVYFIFNAIKQQQYKMAVDEFNEMLDIMNDKIENNDNLPGPDVLAELIQTEPMQEEHAKADEVIETRQEPEDYEVFDEVVSLDSVAKDTNQEVETEETIDLAADDLEDKYDQTTQTLNQNEENADVYTQEELVTQVENPTVAETPKEEDSEEVLETLVEPKFEQTDEQEQKPARKPRKKKETKKEDIMEEKRGRGRPKKVAEGELVITNDKQFEEVLGRAEKLMRKNEEALSASQSKRVEKSLKELIDAMQKYKEEH